MKSLPKEYSLLMAINKYIGEYFAMTVNTKTVRSTDIYEFLKHKEDFRQHFVSAKEFSRFMRRMHDQGVLTQIIKNVKVDTSNKSLYQWYFFPPLRVFSKKTTSENKNIASSHPDKSQFFRGNKKYRAANGTMVRSMQELNIMNRLLAVEIFDVYYERLLVAAGKERYPDFTVYNKETRTVFHWEHFGMTDDLEYGEKMADKIEWYKQIGYKSIDEGGRFIVSVYQDEEHFIGLIDNIIEKMKVISIPCGFLKDNI